VLVAFVSQLVAPEQRGQVVGNVMSALLAGIMLARPLALFVAAASGWRAIFWGSAVLTLGIGFALAKTMPRHAPGGGLSYGRIIASMAGLLMSIAPLRWRAAYQALLFGAFSLFWTTVPLVLVDRFGMGESGIGLFALAGAGGALAAPIAGRLADRGLGQAATAAAMVTAAVSFFATSWAVGTGALVLLVVLAVLIDAAVQTNHIVSQRIIFSTAAATRGRVNALYMTFTFIGGAIGSMLGTLVYHADGWSMTAGAGGLIAVVALVLFGLERAGSAKR
jgi:predicted MFS family arabinose efflux permease